MTSLVLREHAGTISTVTLNRPAALNAVYGAVFHELLSHLAAVDADTLIRVVVLTGAGRAFCGS